MVYLHTDELYKLLLTIIVTIINFVCFGRLHASADSRIGAELFFSFFVVSVMPDGFPVQHNTHLHPSMQHGMSLES